MTQDKQSEIAHFDTFGAEQEYNVFTDASNHRLVDTCLAHGELTPGSLCFDLGCGSGVFTHFLQQKGFSAVGLDLSVEIMQAGKREHNDLRFVAGDVEHLPFADNSLDAILLSGILHHLPEPAPCAKELFRVLKPGGRFVAFDPNRRNPFMWLMRDRSSPFYISEGVTENERPIVASQMQAILANAGFSVKVDFLSGLHYRFAASRIMRLGMPIYNFVDSCIFGLSILRSMRAFVLLAGVKP